MQDAEKVRQRYRKAKAEVKAEMKKIRSSLSLSLDLAYFSTRSHHPFPLRRHCGFRRDSCPGCIAYAQ